MLRSKSFRLALAVLLVGGAVAIAVNYVSRWSPPAKGKHADLLTPQQSRSLTNAVYQERKSGRLRFEVRADWSSETAKNEISLRNVSLTRFDEQGKSSNLVSGKEAVYDQDGKQIRFSHDVHLRLADGTDVYSNSIAADLAREIVNISETFHFQRGDAKGSGQALEYRIQSKEVQVNGLFHLTLPLNEGSAEIQANKALHNLNTHFVNLVGAASIAGGGNRLSAEKIDVEMTEQNKVRNVKANGKGQLEIGPGRSFLGENIDLLFDPVASSLIRLDVSGAGSNDKAIYQEQTTGGENHLEASRIIAVPQKEHQDTVLKDFRADGAVRFRSQPLNITEARAEHLIGFMAAGGKDLEKVHLTGTVSVMRQWNDKPANRQMTERLTSEELELRFRPGQMLDEAFALRNVEMKQTATSLDRDLTAGDSVHLFYREGQLDRVESRGNSRVTENDSAGHRMVSAPSMDAFYKNGRVSRVTAEQGVVLTTEEKGIKRTSTSQTAEALYAEGQLAQLIQRGDVRIHDEEEKSRLDLRASVSSYDAKTAALTLSGGTPFLRYWNASADGTGAGQETETTARRIELYRQTDQIKAEGSVRTVLSQNGDLIVVESGRMEGDRKSGWAVYSDSPRITQKAGTVAGRVVRYNSQDQTVQVDEDVVSDMTDQKGKKYRVTSQHLVYDRQSGRARYEGLVEVTSTDMNLKAPFVELIFKGEKRNQVSEVQAWGGVDVVQGERKAKGPRAVYYPDTQKVVMMTEAVAKK